MPDVQRAVLCVGLPPGRDGVRTCRLNGWIWNDSTRCWPHRRPSGCGSAGQDRWINRRARVRGALRSGSARTTRPRHLGRRQMLRRSTQHGRIWRPDG